MERKSNDLSRKCKESEVVDLKNALREKCGCGSILKVLCVLLGRGILVLGGKLPLYDLECLWDIIS